MKTSHLLRKLVTSKEFLELFNRALTEWPEHMERATDWQRNLVQRIFYEAEDLPLPPTPRNTTLEEEFFKRTTPLASDTKSL